MDETHEPGTAQGMSARLWEAWVGADSPDDASAAAFVRTAEQAAGDETDEAGDGSGDDGGDGGDGGDGAEAAADGGPSAVQVFTSDTVVSDQFDALGAVGSMSDGAPAGDGTYDVDWT